MKTYYKMPSLTEHPSIKGIMKERIAFVDYIRVIACLLVMVVHASEQFYNMGGQQKRLAIPVIGLLTFLCCAVTTKLISLIPGSKYVIG
jgi:surface polysaccharide O-acyltransferase-like enzyme